MLAKLKSLGPGLLYAGAAIGVSHLVQSTRAGAEYGYVLIVAILLAHLFKYPFFALGPRYASEHNESLIAGFARLGKWATIIIGFITLSTMFSIQAAVTIVTAGLAQKIFGISWSAPVVSAALLALCFLILSIGKFKVLDNLMKVIMVVLSISTIIALVFSFSIDTPQVAGSAKIFSLANNEDVSFLLAFVGWMPAPLDIAIWQSIWTLVSPSRENSQFDFKVGFYGTAVLGICFLLLGMNSFYGSGVSLASSAGGFASQLIDVFTRSLGDWSYWLVAIAAFTTMFSTTLTCFDAMPRVMNHILRQWSAKSIDTTQIWRFILGVGTAVILFYFIANMREMVNFATIISFLTAPILAVLCFLLVRKSKSIRNLWSSTESILAIAGILLLISFSFIYLLHIT